MRKSGFALIAAVLACSVAGTAWATSVGVAKTSRKVTFTVENSSPYALVCDGKLTALTKSGKRIEAPMKKESVAPGAIHELYIDAFDDKDPFVDGWSDISCVTPPQPAPPADAED